jgi:membrane fusion protein, heavy metal efflux system
MKPKIFILSILLAACGTEVQNETKNKTENVSSLNLTQKQVNDLNIKTFLPNVESLSFIIFANGTVEVPPQNKTFIAAPFGGYLTKINVLEGSTVKRGQEILRIQHQDVIRLQQEYLEVLGSMEYLEEEVKRQKLLVEKEASSIRNLQMIKSELNTAKARRNGLKVQLEMANVSITDLEIGKIQREQSISAPFDGVVTKVNANLGALAEGKDRLLEIIDLKHAHAEVTVYEKYLEYLREGQLVNLKILNSNQIVKAKIHLIGREIGPDRTVKVHCHFDETPKQLTPGSFFKAEIECESENQLVVPSSSIVQIGNDKIVFGTIDGINFQSVRIKELMNNKEKTAVKFLDAIPNNFKLVNEGSYELLAITIKRNNRGGD